MISQENYFTSFKQSIATYSLPEKFTFPFYYQPHPLCVLAAKELQDYLQNQQQWQHNFGLDKSSEEHAIGKMFGILLVRNKAKEIGYLVAFSGKLAGKNKFMQFVPPVFDMLEKESFFIADELEINKLNKQILSLEKNPQLNDLQKLLAEEQAESDRQIKAHRDKIIAGRKKRKQLRNQAAAGLNMHQLSKQKHQILIAQLAQQSINEKLQLRDLKRHWDKKIQAIQVQLDLLVNQLASLKQQRKTLSSCLQKKLFEQYHFLNKEGVLKSLSDIFEQTPQRLPPSGAGECATPKLLHYAFKRQMTPLAMAEFWWGRSPKSEIRKHKKFYAACKGKCRPILAHMLEGIEMDNNPLLVNPAKGEVIEIVYEDKYLAVINKPAGLLSVPGTNIKDSVFTRMQLRYPDASGPLVVHRLDMSTSGLMLIALSSRSHKILQKQFIKRSIKKRYIALLDGLLKQDQGIIDLPLRVDINDRPRQLVCYQHGKAAKTQWQVIERKNNKTRVYFFPITGRTHQLRVHSSHLNGLNTPIVGDNLYGNKSNRLYLHAEYLEFNHPQTGELVCFNVNAEF